MGLNSKSEKRSADVSLLDEVDNDERPNKRLKPIDSKGGINAIIAEDWKTSSGPPSPVPFLSPDGRISKPAEIFRTDLISAMKLPDTQILNPENYMTIVDPWRQEWERGVQVPVHPEGLPQPSFSLVEALKKTSTFKLPGKLLNSEHKRKGKSSCNYDLNRMDVEWLTSLNKSRRNKGRIELEEEALEKAIAFLEDKCYENLGYAIVTQEGLSIEYDESVCCEVCQSPDSEEGNEMVFCDSCDICVHQACYGIQTIPHGSWLCQPCGRGVSKPPCQLCFNAGGAMKKTKKGKNWVHVSCALWVPEVGFGSVERMEPIIKLENIPASRWNLTCYLCREKVGACIQCTVKSCMTAFHVTCGFKNNLEMRTILDDAAVDGVRHLCYCGKHSHKNKSPPRSPEKFRQDAEEAENLRQKRLKQMEMEFHKYVDVSDAAKDLNIPKELAVHVHAFWTLKRKARDDVPLLPPTLEQQEKLCGKQGAASRTLQIQIEELMKMRCDLERLRNLCYMVSKREKTRRELFRAREQVFWKAHEVMTDENITMGDGDLLWVREACGKNFSGDGSEPSGRLDGPGLEPVSAPMLQLNTSGQSSADDVAGERTHSDEPSDCSESDVRGGYESSDSENSPQIRTRRRFRGSATHISQRDVVNRIRSNTKDTQKSTEAQKSRGAEDSADTEQTVGEDEESRIQECHTPRRSLRFHRAESQDGSSDDSHSLSSCKTSSNHPQERNDEPPLTTNRRRYRTVPRRDADEKMDANSKIPRPRTRGQTSESTSEDSVSESTRTESPAARLSPTRLLRSCKQEPEMFGLTVKTARSRSKSVGDDASTSVRETRSTRLSKSEDEVSSNEAARADHKNRTTPTSSSPGKLLSQKEETLNNELTENYIEARRGRQRTASLNDSLPPPKKRRIDAQRPSKSRSKRTVNGTILDDDSSDVQPGIQALFYKHSPTRKQATVTSNVEFHNGRKSSRSPRSTESESSKSDEENAVDRVQRLSSLRSFNTSKECHLPPSPCPKCQFQQDKDSPTESRSTERKNKELRPRNMQSPRSRNRLLSSLRYSPTRSCANMITQVCHAATVV